MGAIWLKSALYKENYIKWENDPNDSDPDKRFTFRPGLSKVAFISMAAVGNQNGVQATFEFDIITYFRKDGGGKKVDDDDNHIAYYIMAGLLLVCLCMLIMFAYNWKYGNKKTEEEMEQRRSVYQKENHMIRQSISIRRSTMR